MPARPKQNTPPPLSFNRKLVLQRWVLEFLFAGFECYRLFRIATRR